MVLYPGQMAICVAGARRGFSAMYTVVMLVALCGFVSLAVDFGRVQLAKSELQTAADAAVRAAAAGLATSAADARSNAAAIALANVCDGTPVALDTAADVEFGTWDKQARVFTAVGGSAADSATAVRITAKRLASRNTAVPLVFARVVGRNGCDVHASAIATVTKGSVSGFVGLNGVTLKNGGRIASYNSGNTLHPDQGFPSAHGSLASNGAIDAKNATVLGDISLGPSGSSSGCTVTGDTNRLSSPLPTPASPAWNPAPNPGGVPQNYTISRNTTLSGGTYYFTSLNIGRVLSFSGPATLYVNGNIILDGSLIASGWVPSNLKIYQIGPSRTFGDSKTNSMEVVAQIEAPGCDFSAKNKASFFGSATFNTMTFKNAADLYCDEAAGSVSGKAVIAVVD